MTTTPILLLLSRLSSISAIQQLAPLVVILVVPLFVLSGRNYLRSIPPFVSRMLAVASSALPWNWSSFYEHGPASSDPRKISPVRTRAEQLAARTDGCPDVEESRSFYPGLVNISGTYCFMNSTMQALASLFYLQPHIDAIHAKAEAVDIATPVVDALRDLLHGLNTPSSHYRTIRPVEMIAALSQPEPGKRIPLFSSREHQDAQELFQLVSEYVKKEATAVEREGARDLGFAAISSLSSAEAAATSCDVSKGVFDGLTANRRSCCECGYTEAVMHFPFDNWQLTVPRIASCRLEDCLMDYIRLEVLTDCICRKCSMRATLHRLEQDAERLVAVTSKSTVSQSKKKRVREVKRFATRLKAALDEGRIEEDIKGVKMEKVFSRASTKQAMVARPPPVLALHLNRSVHFGAYASKNTARVHFPEVLDLTPYTTSGMLSTSPSIPISSHMPPTTITTAAAASLAIPSSSKTKTDPPPRVLYRLAAIVCHYGQHSFGHYVCFRRKPRGAGRVVPPRLDEGPAAPPAPGRGWLRVSDDAVREVGIETVLQEGAGAFMLYYERVMGEDTSGRSWTGVGLSHAWEAGGDGSGEKKAQQTHRVVVEGAAEVQEKVEQGVVVAAVSPSPAMIKARVVRSVSLGPDEVLGVGGSSAKREVQADVVDPGLHPSESSSFEVGRPVPAAAAPAVELPLAASVKALSPIPEPPVVDEPPISLPRTVDLRA
ncbi:hypothetical protein BJY52DRAFT_62586 [Lactarius psammicola]|nr:hypothetical protein BJY52DRAFT_62586 [Lactarius psammicola]